MVVSAKLALPSKEDLEKQCGTIDDTGENSLSEWHKYFVGKQAALIVFLNKAIELNSAVYCSL